MSNVHDFDEAGVKMTRVEWGVIASLLISALSLAFSFGVIWADVQRHEKRIEAVEDKVDGFSERIARIDANVSFLAEQAREQRTYEKQRRGM